MLELKNNKHNTYYLCTYLYIVNAVIFKRLLTLYLKCDLAQKKTISYHSNMSSYIRACKGSARSSCLIFSGSISGSNWYGNIDAIRNFTRADGTCCFGRGRGKTEMLSKLFSNHNTLGQLTNHNTFSFSEGGPSSNSELIESFVSGWAERYCNNVHYAEK